jgi:hypothetical protein
LKGVWASLGSRKLNWAPMTRRNRKPGVRAPGRTARESARVSLACEEELDGRFVEAEHEMLP